MFVYQPTFKTLELKKEKGTFLVKVTPKIGQKKCLCSIKTEALYVETIIGSFYEK